MLKAKRPVFRTIAIIVALIVSIQIDQPMHALCNLPPPPCEAFTRASIVAIADVIEATTVHRLISPTEELFPQPQILRLRIVEGLKGIQPEQREITVTNKASDHAFRFMPGRYLVYAREPSRGIWDTICTRTKRVDETSIELQELRQCPTK